jgi:DNA-binding NarL/FixJ family response regulator
VSRVVMGDFGAIARLGLRQFLEQEGIEIVAEEQTVTDIFDLLTEVRPDVVMLDLDEDEGLATARLIASKYPAVKVIACSSQEPTMQVFPPFHHGESYASELNTSRLLDAVQG